MSKESLLLFKELLSQIRIDPYQESADLIWEKVKVARDEINALLTLEP